MPDGRKTTCNLDDCFLCNHCLPEWKEMVGLKKTTFLVLKGKQVFKEGEKVMGIFFINSGSVKVHKEWTNGKELIVRFAKTGDILGHRGLGGMETYPIGATALEDTRVCFVDNEFLETTLKVNDKLTYTLMHFYAMELQKAEERMRDLAHMDVKGRIADAVLTIGETIGSIENNALEVTISRQDIASYAGTSYETVFKFFNELAQLGIVSSSGKNIKISRVDLLAAFIMRQN